jgi:hypothetical protein
MRAATTESPIIPKININHLNRSQKCWSPFIQFEQRIIHKMIEARVIAAHTTAAVMLHGFGGQNAHTKRTSVRIIRIKLAIIQTKHISKADCSWGASGVGVGVGVAVDVVDEVGVGVGVAVTLGLGVGVGVGAGPQPCNKIDTP